MKMKLIMLAVGILLIGTNLYAADGDLIVNGNVGVGIAAGTSPISRLDITNYQFVKIGQAGIFLKSTAYTSATITDAESGSVTVTGEAKNVNGAIYTRAKGATDSGWVAGRTATCTYSLNTYTVTATTEGLVITFGSSTPLAEARW